MVAALLLYSTPVAIAAPVQPSRVSRGWLQSDAYPALDDADPKVRAEAVQAIRQAEDRAAVPALVARLDDPDQQVGLYIAQALIELATREELTPLLVTLGRGDANGRWRAAYVLGAIRDTRAVPSLARALRDTDVLVTRTAAEALAGIGSRSAIAALMVSLQSPRQAEVHAAMRGLLTLEDDAVPMLRRAFHSGDSVVKENAATVLEAIGTPAAQRALL
jgi:HEAT repeat protein